MRLYKILVALASKLRRVISIRAFVRKNARYDPIALQIDRYLLVQTPGFNQNLIRI